MTEQVPLNAVCRYGDKEGQWRVTDESAKHWSVAQHNHRPANLNFLHHAPFFEKWPASKIWI